MGKKGVFFKMPLRSTWMLIISSPPFEQDVTVFYASNL